MVHLTQRMLEKPSKLKEAQDFSGWAKEEQDQSRLELSAMRAPRSAMPPVQQELRSQKNEGVQALDGQAEEEEVPLPQSQPQQNLARPSGPDPLAMMGRSTAGDSTQARIFTESLAHQNWVRTRESRFTGVFDGNARREESLERVEAEFQSAENMQAAVQRASNSFSSLSLAARRAPLPQEHPFRTAVRSASPTGERTTAQPNANPDPLAEAPRNPVDLDVFPQTPAPGSNYPPPASLSEALAADAARTPRAVDSTARPGRYQYPTAFSRGAPVHNPEVMRSANNNTHAAYQSNSFPVEGREYTADQVARFDAMARQREADGMAPSQAHGVIPSQTQGVAWSQAHGVAPSQAGVRLHHSLNTGLAHRPVRFFDGEHYHWGTGPPVTVNNPSQPVVQGELQSAGANIISPARGSHAIEIRAPPTGGRQSQRAQRLAHYQNAINRHRRGLDGSFSPEQHVAGVTFLLLSSPEAHHPSPFFTAPADDSDQQQGETASDAGRDVEDKTKE